MIMSWLGSSYLPILVCSISILQAIQIDLFTNFHFFKGDACIEQNFLTSSSSLHYLNKLKTNPYNKPSIAIKSAKPRAKKIVPILECLPKLISGINSSLTT